MKSAFVATCFLLVLGTSSAVHTGSPVERVVNLLQDLKEKLVNDEKVEQQVYDKYACWCEKTTARKAEAIEDAQDELRMLGQTILKLKGKVATLTAEIEELASEIKKNKKEQEEATSIRSKENAAFMAETAETKQALAAMEQAVTVIVKATAPAALLQEQTKATAAVKAVVNALPTGAQLKDEQVALLSEFMGSAGSAKYTPQSMTVQGILKDMYETFATDLETATDKEASANRAFEDFIAVKTAELKQMEETKAEKEAEKAESELRLADTQSIYDDTMEQKKADIKFFDETKAVCEAKHEEWTIRSDLREEEIAGVEKALEILSSDEARALFASSIKAGKEVGAKGKYDTGMDIAPSFLQTSSEGTPMAKAYAALKKQAMKTRSLRLAALAVSVRTAKVGHFEKVVAAINTMIQTLKDEDAADIAKRDQCKDEYQKIESTIKNVTWLIEKNEAKIDKLTKLIEKREEQKAKTIEEMEALQDQMDKMTEQRKDENAEFKNAKEEDQNAIDLLMQAREALSAYYKKNDIAMGDIQGSVKGAFVQQGPEFAVSEDQAPDADFSGKGKRKTESKGIVSILTMIIEDLNDEIKNGMKDEESSQLDYEKMMDAANKLMEELSAKKTALTEAISKRKQERGEEMMDLKVNNDALNDEETYKAEIKPDCDWIIGAFEKRAAARASEMKGLVGAKDFLAGANPGAALLEKSTSFDDKKLASIKFLGVRAN